MKKISFEEIPHYVQIETSYNCNARCVFCYNPKRNQAPDLAKVKEIVDKVAEANIPHVQLTGGEISILPTRFINEIVDKLSKHSTVSIQTNAIKYISGLSKNLAIIYVSLHGTKEYHDELQGMGKWDVIVDNIKKYISDGYEVNLDFTLTAQNYSNFEKIALLANDWGVKQYSLNKFQPAGLGIENIDKMAPTVEQFRDVISQIIKLQKSTKLKIGFCTAVPFCLDERLPKYGLLANCGAGTYLAAISPDGELRICNQSFTSYGNILKTDIKDIWRSKKIDEFRDKSWVTSPCNTCFLFDQCLGGCKVDNTNSQKYCVDYAIRNLNKCPVDQEIFKKSVEEYTLKQTKINKSPAISLSDVLVTAPFTKIISSHKQKLLITKHQTIKLNSHSYKLIGLIINNEITVSGLLREAKKDGLEKTDSVNLVKKLLSIEAIKVK